MRPTCLCLCSELTNNCKEYRYDAATLMVSCDVDISIGEIPASLGQLTKLTILDGAWNKLSGENGQ